MTDPRHRPPLQVAALLRALHDDRIDWVLSGSTVLAVYGADLTPNDLDVVPSLDPENLERLAGLLARLDARPAYLPEWTTGLSLDECRQWTPAPVTPEHLDHLFVTSLGMLDIPPTITGDYARLRQGATRVELADTPVWVCAPEEVLNRIPARARAKDLERLAEYEKIRSISKKDLKPVDFTRNRL